MLNIYKYLSNILECPKHLSISYIFRNFVSRLSSKKPSCGKQKNDKTWLNENQDATRFEEEVIPSIIMMHDLTKALTMGLMKSRFKASGINRISFATSASQNLRDTG